MRAYLGAGSLIRTRIKAFDPDLVHVMYGGVLAEQVSRIVNDRPVIISFCGSDLLGELLSGTVRRIISHFGVVASHWAANRASGIIVKSRNLLAALPRSIDRSKVRIIPNGVDLECFRPLDRDGCRARLGWERERFHVLFPANGGDPVKRRELAFAAVQTFTRLGIQAELHELQGVPHREVPIWLNASDAVLVTSLHEGSPNVVKEALACDVPIVSVDVGDVRERIEHVESCYLAEPEAEDLAAKLQLVHNGPRRSNGRLQIRELSLARTALRLKGFYEEVLRFPRVRLPEAL
jgi:glycosyltransferase involved in cell wall biosynthesis